MRGIILEKTNDHIRFGDSIGTEHIRAQVGSVPNETIEFQGAMHVDHLRVNDKPVVVNSRQWLEVKHGQPKAMKLGWHENEESGKLKAYLQAGIVRKGKLYAVVADAPEDLADLSPVAPYRVTSLGIWLKHHWNITTRDMTHEERQALLK
jgi:hypothetical protein